MILRARKLEFRFPHPVLIMGVVNVTPDSFSDGGQFLEPARAIDQALALAAEGAEIIDLGGESTRPGAQPVSAAEELRRVLPVLAGLSGRIQAILSIDTYKPVVAREALQAGAAIVNDIGAVRQTREMWELVAQTGAAYVAMHMQGTPQTMQLDPRYDDVVKDVEGYFQERLGRLEEAGVARDQVILDVGIGFGKRRQDNLSLLAHLARLRHFERPLLLGVSRKSFLSGEAGWGAAGRLPAALACSCWAVEAGVQILRTHDVQATVQAVRMIEEIRSNRGAEAGESPWHPGPAPAGLAPEWRNPMKKKSGA